MGLCSLSFKIRRSKAAGEREILLARDGSHELGFTGRPEAALWDRMSIGDAGFTGW